jgi:hypothetical protein
MILLTEIVEPAIVIAHLRFIRRRFGMGGIEIPTQLFEDGFFAPEIVDNLSTAFEAAWQNLLASNGLGSPNRRGALRARFWPSTL